MTRTIVIDLDDTITKHLPDRPYPQQLPNQNVVNKLSHYRRSGFKISIHTARNMRTFQNNIGLINANTLPSIIEWLERHQVPYDEVHVGKPWCGDGGFYVDDKSIRPKEFVSLSLTEIESIISNSVAI